MADNVTLNEMSGGAVVAADDISGVVYQRVKVAHGADGSATDTSATSPLPVAATNAYQELTGSAAANNTDLIASTDVRAYRWFSLQLTGTFSATVQVQGSNDGTTWVVTPMIRLSTSNSLSTGGVSLADIYIGTVSSRYLRVRTSTYTSGTANATLELSTEPGAYPFMQAAPPSQLTTSVTPTLGAQSIDDSGTNNTYLSPAAGYCYTGSLWVRNRTATAAKNTTGTGLLGTGALGFDGTNYQALRVDTAGNQYVRHSAGTSAVTSVASSASSVSLLAANTARLQATFYNDSTQVLYLKLGATASATSHTVQIPAGGYFELPLPVYTGAVDGIWAAANGNARITELT